MPKLTDYERALRESELVLQKPFDMRENRNPLTILDEYLQYGQKHFAAREIPARKWINDLTRLRNKVQRQVKNVKYSVEVMSEWDDDKRKNPGIAKITISENTGTYIFRGLEGAVYEGRLPPDIDMNVLKSQSSKKNFKNSAFKKAVVARITSAAGYMPELNAEQNLSDWIDYLKKRVLLTQRSVDGIQFNGEYSGDQSGTSVGGYVDIDDDGCFDLMMGAPSADPTRNATDTNGNAPYTGEAYVSYGCQQDLSNPAELSSLGAENNAGFIIEGINPGDATGAVVFGIGDMNGDGVGDFAIAVTSALNFTGLVAVVYGQKGRLFPNPLRLADLNGENGFIIYGVGPYAAFGSALGRVDINRDGYMDLIVGAPTASPGGRIGAGTVYVFLGRPNIPASVMASDLEEGDGTYGFVAEGIKAGDSLGNSVSGGVDINGDGYEDIVLSAQNAEVNGVKYAGEGYGIFGAEAFGAKFDLLSLDGSNGFRIQWNVPGNCFGYVVVMIDDMNQDGLGEVGIGAPCTMDGPGLFFVILGQNVFTAVAYVQNLDGTTGFKVIGELEDALGSAASAVGDILYQDGFNDLVVCAPNASPNGIGFAGLCAVIAGALTFAPSVSVAEIEGENGRVINGIIAGERSGSSVSGVRDVTNDDIPDILIGAPGGSPGGRDQAGKSYLVEGSTLQETAIIQSPYPLPIPFKFKQSVGLMFMPNTPVAEPSLLTTMDAAVNSFLNWFGLRGVGATSIELLHSFDKIEYLVTEKEKTDNHTALIVRPAAPQPQKNVLNVSYEVSPHARTGAPLFTFRAEDINGAEAGQIQFYGRPDFCHSKDGRNNIVERTGIFASIPLEINEDTEICTLLPPEEMTLRLKAMEGAAAQGVLRGISALLGKALRNYGLNPAASQTAKQAFYYGCYFTFHFMQSPADNATTAAIAALNNLGQLFVANRGLSELSQITQDCARYVQAQGYTRSAEGLDFVSTHLSKLVYVQDVGQQGIVNTLCTLGTGTIVETAIEKMGDVAFNFNTDNTDIEASQESSPKLATSSTFNLRALSAIGLAATSALILCRAFTSAEETLSEPSGAEAELDTLTLGVVSAAAIPVLTDALTGVAARACRWLPTSFNFFTAPCTSAKTPEPSMEKTNGYSPP